MIRPLRQRHRRIVLALGIFLPLALAVGVAGRRPVPTMASLPPGLVATAQAFTVSEWERNNLFTNTPITVRLAQASGDPERHSLWFSAPKDFVKPDLIVYWVAGNPSITDKLPDDASLLGAFNSSSELVIPATLKRGNGSLVLYSLANRAIVEVSKPVTLLKQ